MNMKIFHMIEEIAEKYQNFTGIKPTMIYLSTTAIKIFCDEEKMEGIVAINDMTVKEVQLPLPNLMIVVR